MGKVDAALAALTPLQGQLLDLIVDGTYDPARIGLLALLVIRNVLPFRAALAALDYSTFSELSAAVTAAEYDMAHPHGR